MVMRFLRMCKIFVMKDKSEIIGILWRKVDHSYSYSMENDYNEKQNGTATPEISKQNGTTTPEISKQNKTTSPEISKQNGTKSSSIPAFNTQESVYKRSLSTFSTKIDKVYNKTIGAMSRKIVLTLGNGFHRWGELVVTYPWPTILASLVVCILFSSGLLMYRVETDQAVLWTPYDSPFTKYKNWIDREFPPDRRSEFVVASSQDNVLTAQTIKYLFNLDVRIRTTQSPLADNQTYQDLCYSYPKIARKSQKLFDATPNCQKIIQNLYFESIQEEPCITSGVLGLFRNIIANLTDELVKDTVTCVLQDSTLKDQIGNFIANVQWEGDKVVKADAFLLIWLLAENSTKQADQEERKLGKLYKPKPPTVPENWEKFVFTEEILNKIHSDRPEGLTINALAQRSFEDEVMESVNSNYSILSIGFIILFVYVALVLGNLNHIEQKILLSLCGILVVIMAIASSFGLCFYIGLKMNDIVPITPFLLLGIGVDDMFIMVQSLSSEKDIPIKEKVALALKHAGLSITVTSMTDMAAFAIGATSSMPSLRTFCLFATAGVFFLYIYSITFFVACMILDEKRQRQQIKAHPDWNPPAWTRAKPGTIFFKDYLAKWILKWPIQVLVLAFAVGLFSFGFYGLLNISSNFDSTLYLRSDSYPVKYIKEVKSLFPNELVDVYIGQIDYSTERDCLENMTKSLKENQYIDAKSVDFWYSTFISKFDWCIQNQTISFQACVGKFLLHVPHYFQDVKLTIDLQNNDTEAAQLLQEGQFNITASRAKFQYIKLIDTNAQNEAMLTVREDMAKISFSGENNDFPPIPYTIKFIQWDANRVMSTELLRNLGLTFGTILVISILLLADIFVSFLVFICVLVTIVDIAGFAFFMGIHIEIITSIILILSVGLGLDYVSHIGVTYVVTIEGSRRERAASALGQMGMPVFNGGFSTFLAFILLSKSDSYVFLTFFQMFAMVVLFGLFHGLLVLPVLLSLVGPQSSKEKIIMRERVLTASKEKEKLKKKDLNGVMGPHSDAGEDLEKGQNVVMSDIEKQVKKGHKDISGDTEKGVEKVHNDFIGDTEKEQNVAKEDNLTSLPS